MKPANIASVPERFAELTTEAEIGTATPIPIITATIILINALAIAM